MAAALLVPTIILLVAFIIDVKTHKIPNKWVMISIGLALASSYYFYDYEGLKQGATAAFVALIMTLPLVLFGALGAGDMKLLFAFGLASTYPAVFSVIIFSFIWAAIIGVVLAVAKGRGRLLILNVYQIMTTKSHEKIQTMKIPFSVAIILGWATFLILGIKQGALL
ncbi:MAG: hypothetical protein A2Z20_05480 [Bdellovibrionales bacterium RBG_16_40_8]|nr:MAG: hypothetical protein A2Z20_05480 [Bdellovibrionales bacterium RBG_16_40_8]